MFKRILIANRGEISSRIISSCKQMGIDTVAVFSDEDRSLPFLNQADFAYRVGNGSANTSYANIDSVIEIAKKANVDAIHTGYGFLTNNIDFYERAKKEKIEIIGCNVDFIKKTKDKLALKELLLDEVNCIKSFKINSDDIKHARQIAEKIGFPLILKPLVGKQAKGVRLVNSMDDFEISLSSSSLETSILTNSQDLIIEKYLAEYKFIEVTVIKDSFNNTVVLPEVDLSIQRRHVSVVAESPSTFLSENVRDKMQVISRKIADVLELQGVANIEFFVKGDNIYFNGITPSLSLEHSLIETVTGIDIIKQQILITSNKKIEYPSKNIKNRGHGFLCRIYAEDPCDFQPSLGTINGLYMPSLHNVKYEYTAQHSWSIPIYYDNMLGKISILGKTREDALRDTRQLLKNHMISGIVTNLGFINKLLEHDMIQDASYSLNFMKNDFVANYENLDNDVKKVMKISTVIRSYNKHLKQGKIVEKIKTSKWSSIGRSL